MRPLCVGIAGGTGSGKTTVAREIARRVGGDQIVIVNQDRYYRDLGHLAEDKREHRNFDRPEAVDCDLFVDHLTRLKDGRPAPLPIYDFMRHLRTDEIEEVQPRPVVIVEGILVLALEGVRGLLDVKLFVDADPDIRFIRRQGRDILERGRTVEGIVEQYLASVRPMHLEFVEPSKRWADVIIPEGGFNVVALDLVVSRIRHALQEVK